MVPSVDYFRAVRQAEAVGIATRFPKQQLNWDEKKLAFSNSEAATAFVKREYRKGWEVKGL